MPNFLFYICMVLSSSGVDLGSHEPLVKTPVLKIFILYVGGFYGFKNEEG